MVVKKKVVTISFLGMTVLLFVYVCYIGVKNILLYNAFKAEYKTALVQYEEEVHLNNRYKESMQEMQGPDYWELQAKQQLGYVKKGEVVYKLKAL